MPHCMAAPHKHPKSCLVALFTARCCVSTLQFVKLMSWPASSSIIQLSWSARATVLFFHDSPNGEEGGCSRLSVEQIAHKTFQRSTEQHTNVHAALMGAAFDTSVSLQSGRVKSCFGNFDQRTEVFRSRWNKTLNLTFSATSVCAANSAYLHVPRPVVLCSVVWSSWLVG